MVKRVDCSGELIRGEVAYTYDREFRVHAVDRKRGTPFDVAAYSQNGGAFEHMYIFKDFIDKHPIGDDVAGVILHERGHLARKDTKDNEPKNFFTACQCGTIDPGKRR